MSSKAEFLKSVGHLCRKPSEFVSFAVRCCSIVGKKFSYTLPDLLAAVRGKFTGARSVGLSQSAERLSYHRVEHGVLGLVGALSGDKKKGWRNERQWKNKLKRGALETPNRPRGEWLMGGIV